MINQTKILIGIFVITVLVSGFFVYNKILAPERLKMPEKFIPQKPIASEEKLLPKLTISAPSELEVVAYKSSFFNFSIENAKEYSQAKDVKLALSLKESPVSVSPNNINIFPGESQNFEAHFDKLEPGNYDLYIKIQGEPNVRINKTIVVKSQIVVGLDGYHNYNYNGIGNCWRKEFETEKSLGLLINETPSHPFVQYISKECKNHYCAGRYYPFAENLEQVGIKTKIIESPLSSDMLNKINVLVLLAPWSERLFSFTEKEELKNFLNNGGGLLLIEPGYYNCPSAINPNLKDLIETLHLNVRLKIHRSCTREYPDPKEIEEYSRLILKHPVTLGIEEIPYSGFYTLEAKPPIISLVELKEGETIYAIQYYAKGKIGIISSTMQLEYSTWASRSYSYIELHRNLIKWLAAPEVYEKMG